MGTLKEWIHDNLADYLEDIATYGAREGFPGITYYTDTVALYDAHAQEIWDHLAEAADAHGYRHPLALVATFNGAENAWSDDQWKNLLVWHYAEAIATEASDE